MGDLLVLNEGRTKIATGIGFDPRNIDPFYRLITAQPIQLGSYDHRINKQPDYWDEQLTGSGTSTHNANTVSIDMATTTASGDKVVRRTFRQFEYKRGNSQSVYLSCVLGDPKANTVKRIGYFDNNNGVFVETNGTTLRVVVRSKTSGSVVDTAVDRVDFNGDKLDGAGPSGKTLDLSKQNLFVIDMSWLGTNLVRFSAVIGGELVVMHSFNFASVIASPYTQSAQLPISAEIQNTGTVASSTTMSVTCCAVFSNGATNGENRVRSVSSGTTSIAINATEKVIAGIRLKTTLANVGAEGIAYDFLASSGTTNVIYKVILRASLTGPTWASTSDVCDALTNNPTYTGGIILEQGHISLASAARTRISVPAKTDMHLGYAIDGTPDSLIMVVRTDSGNGNLFFDGYFREIV